MDVINNIRLTDEWPGTTVAAEVEMTMTHEPIDVGEGEDREPNAWPIVAASGCECPEFCLLDHDN